MFHSHNDQEMRAGFISMCHCFFLFHYLQEQKSAWVKIRCNHQHWW